jgi:hypothetical protein
LGWGRWGALVDEVGVGRPVPSGSVVVASGARRWRLGRGERVTIGRSSSCAIQLPADEYLSRRAAALDVLEDCVLVRNLSGSKPLVLRPPLGEDRVVEPGAATTSLPFQAFTVVLAGRDGAVQVRVDASGVTPAAGKVTGRTRSAATAASPITFTPGQRRILVALCRPLLCESGSRARPATYAEIGAQLGLRPQYVRNVVKAIRDTLAGYGVAGLVTADAAAPNDDFRLSLAHWLLWTGLITAADLDEDVPAAHGHDEQLDGQLDGTAVGAIGAQLGGGAGGVVGESRRVR